MTAAITNALVIAGAPVRVPGVRVISPREQPWCFVAMGKDARFRTRWPTQIFWHKSIADDPEHVLAGAGAAGGAQRTAEFFQQSDGKTLPYRNAGAHGIADHDGSLACLCDLASVETFHATVSNACSMGFEMAELAGGGVQQATLETAVQVTLAIAEAAGVQLQVPKLGSYNGHPLHRMLDGGSTCVGVFGHRDNTEARGRWDPGDTFFEMLVAAGAEHFDFAAGEDLAKWRERQTVLVAKGHKLIVDGVPGPATTAALKADGYRGGVYALGRS